MKSKLDQIKKLEALAANKKVSKDVRDRAAKEVVKLKETVKPDTKKNNMKSKSSNKKGNVSELTFVSDENEFMVRAYQNGEVIDIYTYLDKNSADRSLDSWKSEGNPVFIHAPKNGLSKALDKVKGEAYLSGEEEKDEKLATKLFVAGKGIKSLLKDEPKENTMKKIDFTKVNRDVNGNPRYAVHFLEFITDEDKGDISEKYETALKRAKRIGGKKYDNKEYGGGIVFQSYNIDDTEKKINELMKEVKGKKTPSATKKATPKKSALESAKEKSKSRKKPAVKKAKVKVKKEKDWKLDALKELRKYTDNKDLRKAHYGESDDNFDVTSGNTEYRIFKTEKDAEYFAIQQVKDNLKDEPELFSQSFLEEHLYVSDIDKRLIASEEGDNYIENLRYDGDVTRILEEADMLDEYEAEENESKKELIVDKAEEKIKENIYEEWYKGLDRNPVDFLVNKQRLYSMEDLGRIHFLSIDTNKASEAAVRIDGVAHFLSSYDGNEIELPGGYVAYRTN